MRFPLILILLEGGVFAAIDLSLQSLAWLQSFGVAPLAVFGISAAGTAATIMLWKAARRWLEGERDHEFTGRAAAWELACGIGAGAGLFCLVTAIAAGLGGIAVTGVRPFAQTEFWIWAAIAIVTGAIEEIVFRGVLLRQLERLTGTWIALGLSAAGFGLLHLANRDATLAGAFSLALESGLLLGAAYLYTRRLWLVAGLHGAWNFTQAWLFSVPVSGTGQPIGLLVTRRVGPEWLTGGDFGLEASLPALFVAANAGLVLLWLAYRRGHVVAAPWSRHTKL
ncbi:MAG: CPBP family intramembrane glutamic endopeptidase [Croceibacterium sp.]